MNRILVRSYATKSEYLYGTSVVISALESMKRQVLNLYVKNTESTDAIMAMKLASKYDIPIAELQSSKMDKLSENRPNQGLLLHTRPLEIPKITSLSEMSEVADEYQLEYANSTISKTFNTSRPFPFWIALDRIVDPQNLGAILRTSYFFGVDGVILTSKDRYL